MGIIARWDGVRFLRGFSSQCAIIPDCSWVKVIPDCSWVKVCYMLVAF